MGQSRLDIAPSLAVRLGARTATGLLARQTVELRIKPARGELLRTGDLLAALPPVALLGRAGDRLRPGFALLVDVRPFGGVIFLA